MLEHAFSPYGSDEPEKLMEKFYNAGNEMLLTLRNYVTNPDSKKKPRMWGAIEAAQMIGISNPTFRRLIEKHPNLPGMILETTKSNKKPLTYYEMHLIPNMLDHPDQNL